MENVCSYICFLGAVLTKIMELLEVNAIKIIFVHTI